MTPRTTLPALVAETPPAPQPPALVLFGRDGAGRPRAAWFDAADARVATAAAETMRLRALPVTEAEPRALAQQFARGRVLPSGRALVPFAKRELYGRLVALAGEGAGLSVAAGAEVTARADAPTGAGGTSSGAEEKPPAPRPGDRTFVGSPQPTERAEIGLGSVVLALEGPDGGWWEAEVIGINGGTFSLRWCDYDPAAFPTILRKAGELALLPPVVG